MGESPLRPPTRSATNVVWKFLAIPAVLLIAQVIEHLRLRGTPSVGILDRPSGGICTDLGTILFGSAAASVIFPITVPLLVGVWFATRYYLATVEKFEDAEVTRGCVLATTGTFLMYALSFGLFGMCNGGSAFGH